MADSGGGAWFCILLAIVLLQDVLGSSDSVRWEASEFGPCSVPCGGGIAYRTLRCVRIPAWYEWTTDLEVPATQCPLPSPPVTRPCNHHMCSGHWTKGNWSECSVTCGVGTQTRTVECESSMWSDQRFQVSRAECGGSPPDSSRKCHVMDCPLTHLPHPPAILAENYTLIQLHRTKKIKVVVGGKVKLLPRQTVVVKCPVKNYSRKLLYWSKGYKLVSFMGRVRITPGGLRISKADPREDGGVYTCIAGDVTASIVVEFSRKGDETTKFYKKWIRKAKRQLQNFERRELNEVLPNSANADDLDQQRDQSQQNVSNSLTYVSGDWSECTATCGVEGHRKRKVSCSQVTSKYVKIVPDTECSRWGLARPSTEEGCTYGHNCPVWRPGPWTKCRPSCGESGHMTRFLVCEWKDTGLPAWHACDLKSKPVATKPCKPRPCPRECKDDSRYCSLSKIMKLCRFARFQRECCHTCHKLENLTY